MEQILGWIDQNHSLTIVIATLSIIIFFLSIKRMTTKIFASSRGVAIGGNSNAPIITGGGHQLYSFWTFRFIG